MTRKTRWIFLAALFAVFSFAACDDDASVNYANIDDPNPDADPEPSADPEPEGEPEPTPDQSPTMEPEAMLGAVDGAACDDDSDCAGGTCFPEADGFPDGHCTTTDCAEGNACTGGAQCAFLDSERQESACFALCDDGTPCREGYTCETFGNVSLCQPDPPEVEMRDDGEPCTDRTQCAGGVCLTEDDGFPGGHCTTVNCESRMDCAGDGRACLLAGRPNYCIVLCNSQIDCRDDYICQPIQGGGYCAPSPTAGNNVPEEGELPFDLVCGDTFAQADAFQGGFDRHELTFELPDDTTSFMVVPYSGGDQIFPVELEGPGGSLNMFEEYGFALANASFMINLTPILVPQAPQFADFVSGGEHTLTMASNSDLCRYVIPKNNEGSQVDLNIHFVGTRGINAGNAQSNEGFQRALERFDEIYAQIGTQTRNIRYIDVTGDDANRFRVVRSQEAAFQLVAISETPGDTKDEALSINVFFIDQFAIQGGSVLGISSGLPGAAGIHGARGSGLIFAASVLGDPNLLGQVLAHEVGHYLGLFHTTEQGGRGFDPLADTEQCAANQWGNPNACPDINNLMFPFAGNSHTEISDNQDSVLHANPLIK